MLHWTLFLKTWAENLGLGENLVFPNKLNFSGMTKKQFAEFKQAITNYEH